MTEEIKYNKDEKWVPYKQLEETPQQTIDRLEQENKELKAQVDYLSKRETELISEITDIVTENKNFNEELIDFSKRMENQRENYYKEYNKYRSALEEIKNSVINYLPEKNYKFAKSFNPEEFELLENILNKINEVLGENNE